MVVPFCQWFMYSRVVESHTFWTIVLGGLVLGIIRETLRAYWAWKARRLLLPAAVRNAGIVTDGRIRAFEIFVLTIFLAHTAALAAFIVWWALVGNELI